MIELKKQIEQAIQNFSVDATKTAAEKLLATLGYRSNKKANINLDALKKRAADKGVVANWKEFKSAELIFQLTDDELKPQSSMFTVIDEHLMQSYLFFAVELSPLSFGEGQGGEVKNTTFKPYPFN